jgi:hypothetical protein
VFFDLRYSLQSKLTKSWNKEKEGGRRRGKGGMRRKEGAGSREEGGGRREKGEGRREKGPGREALCIQNWFFLTDAFGGS